MLPLALHDFHAHLGAQFLDRQGFEAVESYGDPAREHRALHESCGWLDLSYRNRIVLLGKDRAKLLHGQVTNNIKDLKPGEGCYAALVNAKAKMLADLQVFALENELLLDLEPGLAASVGPRLEKFFLADDVQWVDAAPHYGLLSLQGPRALRALESLHLLPQPTPHPYTSTSVQDPELGTVYVMNLPRVGAIGFDVYVPVASQEALAQRMLEAARGQGGGPVGWTALETARIEAGIPRYGADMDDTILPPEAGLEDRAISYTKGCYSGQEVIARIRTYGQVSKALRGLTLSAGPTDLPASRTKLFRNGKETGFITSAVWSPIRGETIALGYVRRENNGPGTELQVGSPESTRLARIVPLPFVGPSLASP